jgi:hypothetical protein
MKYKNCLNCPHNKIDISLKIFFQKKTGDNIFENCSKEDAKNSNILCFGVGRRINWSRVFDDFSKMLRPEYLNAKK